MNVNDDSMTTDHNAPRERSAHMHRLCPICRHDNRCAPALAYSRAPWDLKECAECGFVYIENPPRYEALNGEFAWEKTWAAESMRRKRVNPVLYAVGRATRRISAPLLKRDKLMNWTRRYLRPGPILDVGCSDGHSLNRLPRQFTPYGIEVSEALGRQAAELYSARGGRVVIGAAISMDSHFAAGFFGGIIMSSFLEHEADVLGILAAARRVMQPAARLIVKVPNYSCWNRAIMAGNWCGFRFPDHVNYFTPEMLRKTLCAAGFRIVRFGLSNRFPTNDNMRCVAECSDNP